MSRALLVVAAIAWEFLKIPLRLLGLFSMLLIGLRPRHEFERQPWHISPFKDWVKYR